MPKYYTTLQKAAHFNQLYASNDPEYANLLHFIALVRNGQENLVFGSDQYNDSKELIGLLESMQNTIESGMDVNYNNISQTASTIREFEQKYSEYMEKYPEEQDKPFHETFKDLWARPADKGNEFLNTYGPTKTATQWIDEAKAELANNTYEPARYLARIIAARQLANAERGHRRNIDRTQLTEGQLENRTRQLLEDPTFRAFLKANAIPSTVIDPNVPEELPSNWQTLDADKKNHYLGLLSQGHGGAFEDELDEFVKQQKDFQDLDTELFGRYQNPLYAEDLYTQDLIPSGTVLPPGQRNIEEEDIAELSAKVRNFPENIGIFSEPNRVTGANGPLRIFTISEDAEGNQRMMSLKDAGLEPGSMEYLKAFQQGKVYAYPAGDTRPVQVQLRVPQNENASEARIRFSEPVSPEELCPYPEPEKPGFFTRMFARVSSRARQRMDDYAAAKAKRDGFLSHMNEAEEQRKKSSLDERRLAGEMKDKQAKEQTFTSLQNKANEVGPDRFLSIYKPTPEMREDLLQARMYPQDAFAQLRPVDIDLSKVKIGGQEVSEEEFGMLACGIARQPKFAVHGYSYGEEKGEVLHNKIKQMGYSDQDTDAILSGICATNFSIDYFKETPRKGLDFAFKKTVQPAREEAASILKEYQQGKKENLAKYLAESITEIVKDSITHTLTEESESYNGFLKMSGRLGDMLERDPELKSMAMQNYNLKESTLKTLKGMARAGELNVMSKEAQRDLAEASKNGNVLGTERKKECLNTILKARIVNELVNNEKDKIDKAAVKFEQELDRAFNFFEPGEEYSHFMTGVEPLLKDPVKTFGQLSNQNTEDNLDQIANSIIEKDNLWMQPEGKLLKTLNTDAYQGNDLVLRGKGAINNVVKDPVLQNQSLNLNIQNEDPEKNQNGLQVDGAGA